MSLDIIFPDDNSRECKTVYEQLRKDGVKNEITNTYPKLISEIHCNSFQINVNFGPACIFTHQWQNISTVRQHLHNVLLSLPYVLYIASTIEHHHKDPIKKLSKKQSPAQPSQFQPVQFQPAQSFQFQPVQPVQFQQLQPQSVKPLKKGKSKASEDDPDEPDEPSEIFTYDAASDKHKIYFAKSLVQFTQAFSNLARLNPKDVEMSEEEERYVLYNFFHVLKYRSKEMKIDNDFEEYLDNIIKQLTDYILIPASRNFKIEDNWKLLANLHKEYYTTLGFPHLHLSVCVQPTKSNEDILIDLNDIITKLDISPDCKIDPTSSEKSSMEGRSLQYIIKNDRNSFVRSVLAKYGNYNDPIILVDVSQTKYSDLICEFFSNIGSKYRIVNGQICGTKKSYRPIPLRLRCTVDDNRPAITSTTSTTSTFIEDGDPDNYHLVVLAINGHMKDNNLAICDSRVYQKLPEAKMTWRPYKMSDDEATNGDLSFYYDYVTAAEPIVSFAGRYKIDIVNRMAQSSKMSLLQKDPSKLYIGFPTISMDYRMLEFGNFFFNSLTRTIYLKQDKYYCYFYCPYTLETIASDMNVFRDTSRWYSTVKRQKPLPKDDQLAIAFYSLLLPKSLKDLVLLIYGYSNSGKTTLIEPFKQIYPPHLKTNFGSVFTEHHIADQIVNKQLVVYDECNNMLNPAKTDRGMILKVLAGESITANKKHGAITESSFKGASVLSMNIDGTETFADDEAYLNRIFPCGPLMARGPNEITDSKMDIDAEAGHIFLFCAIQYQRAIDNSNLAIEQELTDEHFKLIEDIKAKFDSSSSDKTFSPISPFSNEGKLAREQSKQSLTNILHRFVNERYKQLKSDIKQKKDEVQMDRMASIYGSNYQIQQSEPQMTGIQLLLRQPSPQR